MKLNKYIAIALILISVKSFSQSSSLPFGKKNASDTSHGYNKMIGDGFIGFGFVLGGDNAGALINYGQSREFIIGAGVGRRFVKWNGIGIDIYYKSTDFYLTQDSAKILPDKSLHKDEKISFDNLGGLVYDRFYLGTFFIDGGFYYDWTFYTKHITWDDPAGSNAGTVKVLEKQLSYTQPSNYGLTFRAGKSTGVSFYFNYRLSKLFKGASSSYIAYPELPVYVLGVILGVH